MPGIGHVRHTVRRLKHKRGMVHALLLDGRERSPLGVLRMVEYQLCCTWSCVAEWVRDFQTLIAGILAIFAGALAYLGARASRYSRRLK